MKIVLVVLAVLSILGGLVGCILSIGSNVIFALLVLGSGIISSVPYFALIFALEEIAALRDEQLELKGKLRRLIDAAKTPSEGRASEAEPSQPFSRETSRHTWKCVRCQTINKSGTSSCSGCGAHYSPWVNTEW